MSDDIHIGSLQAGAAVTGGTGHTVESGTLNIHGSQGGDLVQLRSLIEELAARARENPVPPRIIASIEEARTESAKEQPSPGKLRSLMNVVRAGAEKVTPVATAALNILNLVNAVEQIR